MHLTSSSWIAISGAAAGGALIISVLALVLQLLDRHNRNAEKKQDQANHISAWVSRTVDTKSDDDDDDDYAYFVNARNLSEQPVYSVYVRVRTEEPALVMRYVKWDVLPPGETLLSDITDDFPRGALTSNRQVTLTFQDALGKLWQRRPDGIIERAESVDVPFHNSFGGGVTLYKAGAFPLRPDSDVGDDTSAERRTATTKPRSTTRNNQQTKRQPRSARGRRK